MLFHLYKAIGSPTLICTRETYQNSNLVALSLKVLFQPCFGKSGGHSGFGMFPCDLDTGSSEVQPGKHYIGVHVKVFYRMIRMMEIH